jgi:hypothetical protein
MISRAYILLAKPLLRVSLLAFTAHGCGSDVDDAGSRGTEAQPDVTTGDALDVAPQDTTTDTIPSTDAPQRTSPSACTALEGASPPPGSTLEMLCELPAATDAPIIGDPVTVAPSGALPPEVKSQVAHNNLDVEWHDGRLFLAVRTAPDHFASTETTMFVVSTNDLDQWRFEGRWKLGTDVREPQLVSMAGELVFYFAVLGDDPLSFKPQGVRRTRYRGPKEWSDLETVFASDFIPWRTQRTNGTLYLTGYTGGANIYEIDGEPTRVSWLQSQDGLEFAPVVDGHEVVLQGGMSETDFAFLTDVPLRGSPGGDGTELALVAVSRNEAGGPDGFGSKICTATVAEPHVWTCTHDPRKYDSPLVFRHGDTVFLVARRNVTDSGAYDLGLDDLPLGEQYTAYQAAYWVEPKRCALWNVDPTSRAVTHLVDLPSRGDTCFPERLPLTDTTSLIFNYTSPLGDGPDPAWYEGQTGPTAVIYTTLQLPSTASRPR